MNRRQELVAFAAGVLVIAIAAYFLAIRPKAGEVGDAHAQARKAAAQSESLRQDIKSLEAIRANAVPLQTRQRSVQSLFPRVPALPDLVNGLQRVADQAGVDLTSIQPSVPVTSPGQPALAQLPVSIHVDGTYFQVEDFLLRLEGMVASPDPALRIPPRALLVQAVNLTKAGTAASASGATAATPANPDGLTADIKLVGFEAVQLPTTPSSGSTAGTGTGAAAATSAKGS